MHRRGGAVALTQQSAIHDAGAANLRRNRHGESVMEVMTRGRFRHVPGWDEHAVVRHGLDRRCGQERVLPKR